MTENDVNGPWKEMYERMGAECPENGVERRVLEKMGRGESIPDCLEYWKAAGMNEESFLQFMRRADEWEAEELRRLNHKQGSL